MPTNRHAAEQRLVLNTLLPANAHPLLPLSGANTRFDAFYAEFDRTVTPRLRTAFRLAVWAALWISPLLIGRLPPLTRLEPPARERALGAMARSRVYLLRQLLMLLKLVVGFCYGAEPEVRAAIGYPHTPISLTEVPKRDL